jgi:hypothetical protein
MFGIELPDCFWSMCVPSAIAGSLVTILLATLLVGIQRRSERIQAERRSEAIRRSRDL